MCAVENNTMVSADIENIWVSTGTAGKYVNYYRQRRNLWKN